VLGLLLPPQFFPFSFLRRCFFLIGFYYFFHVNGGEFVRVVAVRCAASRTQTRFGFADTVPTPHTDLVAAFTGEELTVGHVEFFAAEGADIIIIHHGAFIISVAGALG
jgi:hypothetical protein